MNLDLRNRFNYHPPDEKARARHERARIILEDVAQQVVFLTGETSREQSLALTHLEEAMFWTNAAIARIDERGTRR